MERLKPIHYFGLFTAAVLLGIAMLWIQPRSFYMDADYYYANGKNLAQGSGLWESFIWNFLDQPKTLPHPAFTYWMPAASLLAAGGMLITKSTTWIFARLPFILLYGIIPPFTAFLAFRLSKKKWTSFLAGGMTLCCGYYLKYVTQVDSVALCMVLGSLVVLLLAGEQTSLFVPLPPVVRYLLLGSVAGAMHLARADGILWLLFIYCWFIYQQVRQSHKNMQDGRQKSFLSAAYPILAISSGYLLITSFWYFRNLQIYQALLPPGGGKTLWLIDYNQLFTLHPENLTISGWLGSGLWAILRVRLNALLINLVTFIGVEGMVILIPFLIIGLRRNWRNSILPGACGLWAAYFVVMTLFFPFAGLRGGFIHSTAGFQPLLWALAAVGFSRWTEGIARKGKWTEKQSGSILGVELILILGIITVFFGTGLKFGLTPSEMPGYPEPKTYQKIDTFIRQTAGENSETILINNPPAYNAATGGEAVVIPDGTEEDLLSAARQFNARWLALDQNNFSGFEELYTNPYQNSNLSYRTTIDGIELFEIKP